MESCVNYVGVDVNSASPALLGYVSGLNQLTARRIYEYRQQNGPFRNREQLKSVPGIGDATYVQAAGFLKIIDGDNPLDSTWIHPESYSVAQHVLEEVGCDPSQLARGRRKAAAPPVGHVPPDEPVAPPTEPALGEAPPDEPVAPPTESALGEAPPDEPAAPHTEPALGTFLMTIPSRRTPNLRLVAFRTPNRPPRSLRCLSR